MRSAAALATMRPVMLLRVLDKAARREVNRAVFEALPRVSEYLCVCAFFSYVREECNSRLMKLIPRYPFPAWPLLSAPLTPERDSRWIVFKYREATQTRDVRTSSVIVRGNHMYYMC